MTTMPSGTESGRPIDAGAVLYAKDLARVQAFYQGTLNLEVEHREDDHVVLASSAFQLVIVKILAQIASARTSARLHGGELNAPDSEWTWRGHRVCDGHDPEGNIVQFRQALP